MEHIHPICHETVYPLIGRKVCAVTGDGKRYYGTISSVTGGRVLLTDCSTGAGALSLASVKNRGKTRRTNSGKKAKLSGFYGPYGYGYGYGFGAGAYWLSLAAITTLFLLPFFFI